MGKVIYTKIYDFQVLDELKKYQAVFVVDKQSAEVKLINAMDVARFITIINHDNSDNRYEFYKEERENENG